MSMFALFAFRGAFATPPKTCQRHFLHGNSVNNHTHITFAYQMDEVVTIGNFGIKLPPVKDTDAPLHGLIDMGR